MIESSVQCLLTSLPSSLTRYNAAKKLIWLMSIHYCDSRFDIDFSMLNHLINIRWFVGQPCVSFGNKHLYFPGIDQCCWSQSACRSPYNTRFKEPTNNIQQKHQTYFDYFWLRANWHNAIETCFICFIVFGLFG